MPPSHASRARPAATVALTVVVAATTSGCSLRQAEADQATASMVPVIVAKLEEAPRATWSRPSARTRESLAKAPLVYRVLGTRPDGSTSIAVWFVDRGRTIWSDDEPRVGLACARLGTAEPLSAEPKACPAGVSATGAFSSRVLGESLDWSDSSMAYDQASIDIHGALKDAQWAVKDGRVGTVAALQRHLESAGLTVRPRGETSSTSLSAEVRLEATAPRLSDPSEQASGRVCARISMSTDRDQPYYGVDKERAC